MYVKTNLWNDQNTKIGQILYILWLDLGQFVTALLWVQAKMGSMAGAVEDENK